MTENIMTTENIRMNEKSLLSHKEFHAIMKRPQFKCDLSGQDATDYDDFIDAKIQEFTTAHNAKVDMLFHKS